MPNSTMDKRCGILDCLVMYRVAREVYADRPPRARENPIPVFERYSGYMDRPPRRGRVEPAEHPLVEHPPIAAMREGSTEGGFCCAWRYGCDNAPYVRPLRALTPCGCQLRMIYDVI